MEPITIECHGTRDFLARVGDRWNYPLTHCEALWVAMCGMLTPGKIPFVKTDEMHRTSRFRQKPPPLPPLWRLTIEPHPEGGLACTCGDAESNGLCWDEAAGCIAECIYNGPESCGLLQTPEQREAWRETLNSITNEDK